MNKGEWVVLNLWIESYSSGILCYSSNRGLGHASNGCSYSSRFMLYLCSGNETYSSKL